MLQARLAGQPPERVAAAEWRRGAIPPGALGARLLDELGRDVEPLVAAQGRLAVGEPDVLDVAADIGPVRLIGSVPGVRGDVIVRTTFSRLAAKHRLRAWAQLLALQVARPDRAWRAVTIGRGGQGGGCAASALGPVDAATAARVLADLVDLRAEGLREPLPLIAKTSEVYAATRARGIGEPRALAAARAEWESEFSERLDDHALRACWGDPPPFEALAGAAASGGGERTRFGELALRVWRPLLAAESLGRA
jgi:exodeoxyribonuclease V gamma subunit